MSGVKALQYPEKVVGILSFDFDGTLHDPSLNAPVDGSFFETIQHLHPQGWLWGINTGRSTQQMIEGMVEGRFPFLPDFLIARERELYTPGAFGRWLPVADWHKQSARAHKQVFRKAKKLLRAVKGFVEKETEAHWIEQENDPAGVIAQDEAEMQRIVDFIETHRDQCELLGYLRNSIYLRFSHIDYHKGSTLREFARLVDVPVERTFAIGDGHNDLDKLMPEVAGMRACVRNAHPEVVSHLSKHGGYVARKNASLGAIEALQHFLPEYF